MIEGRCKGGPLDGQIVFQPDDVNQFESFDGVASVVYKKFTRSGEQVEWRCKQTSMRGMKDIVSGLMQRIEKVEG